MGPRSRHLSSTVAVLLLFAACLGSRERGEGCACREELPREAAAMPEVTSEVTLETSPAVPAALVTPLAKEEGPALEVVLPDFADPAWTRVASRAGTYLVCWRARTDQVLRNQDFELEVWVLRNGAPVRDAVLGVSGWMPEHAHGMLRTVRPEARGDGSFRVEGMLLHMRGHWLLRFDVLEGSLSETAECALDL